MPFVLPREVAPRHGFLAHLEVRAGGLSVVEFLGELGHHAAGPAVPHDQLDGDAAGVGRPQGIGRRLVSPREHGDHDLRVLRRRVEHALHRPVPAELVLGGDVALADGVLGQVVDHSGGHGTGRGLGSLVASTALVGAGMSPVAAMRSPSRAIDIFFTGILFGSGNWCQHRSVPTSRRLGSPLVGGTLVRALHSGQEMVRVSIGRVAARLNLWLGAGSRQDFARSWT